MMETNWFKTAARLDRHIRNGDTLHCQAEVEKVLKSLPKTPFHRVLDLNFSNSPKSVAARIGSDGPLKLRDPKDGSITTY